MCSEVFVPVGTFSLTYCFRVGPHQDTSVVDGDNHVNEQGPGDGPDGREVKKKRTMIMTKSIYRREGTGVQDCV